MDFGLKGRVALITGAARGIGRAEAEALAAEGAIIALNDLDPDAAAQTAAEISQSHDVTALPFAADVTDEASVEALFSQVEDAFGRLDILVNNAGIGGKRMGHLLEDLSVENWDVMITGHLRSTYLCSRRAVAPMKTEGFGRIINTSSQNYTGGGRKGVSNYAAAKAGIAGFTRTIAKELGGYGITVNALAPGYVETDLIRHYPAHLLRVMIDQNPIGRLCQPEEVGAAVAFLSSSQAAFINGAIICIDGGKQDFHWE